jgi:hypothetical protein
LKSILKKKKMVQIGGRNNFLAESNKDLYTDRMKNNTQEVQTYEWSGEDGNGMIPVSNGEWVSVDDYRKLYSDYLLLESRIEDLEDIISDLRYEERFRGTRD